MKPQWLTEPPERKIKLKQLAANGVSRKVIRAVTGWSNNQMASFATSAGFSFEQFTQITAEAMRKPLRDAGFSGEDIDAAIALQGRPVKHRAPPKPAARKKPRHISKKKRKTRPAKRKRSRKRQPVEPPTELAAPEQPLIEMQLTELPAPEGEEPPPTRVDDVEARAAAEAAIRAAASEAPSIERPKPSQAPAQIPRVPQRFIATVVDPNSCRCPVPGDLHGTSVCGEKPVVYEGVCEKHADILFGKRWREKIGT